MIEYFFNLYIKDDSFQEEIIVCITGDHTTPVLFGDHSFEPVPFALTTSSNFLRCLNKKEKIHAKIPPFSD